MALDSSYFSSRLERVHVLGRQSVIRSDAWVPLGSDIHVRGVLLVGLLTDALNVVEYGVKDEELRNEEGARVVE